MSQDPTPSVDDFLIANDIVRQLQVDLAIEFKTAGETFDHAKMQQHVNDRAALIRVQELLLDAGERILKIPPP